MFDKVLKAPLTILNPEAVFQRNFYSSDQTFDRSKI